MGHGVRTKAPAPRRRGRDDRQLGLGERGVRQVRRAQQPRARELAREQGWYEADDRIDAALPFLNRDLGWADRAWGATEHGFGLLLDRYVPAGGRVLDPLAGSGTTLVQSLESGREATGIDVAAFNCLLMRVKTAGYNEFVLASEIRDFLVTKVSRTGGHLGPNLGVVELTMAIHRVFDSPTDRVIFDTGHQAYVHKALTGRAGQFDTLRQEGGLSGYPSHAESDHDVVENSHASTALSYADGLAKAFSIRGEDRYVVAVIGDGALTGGMAWEALNNIAVTNTNIVVRVPMFYRIKQITFAPMSPPEWGTNPESTSGSTKKITTAKPMERTMLPTSMPRLMAMSSPSAAIAAERMSMRVPRTSVSYRTNIPRTNGTRIQRPRDRADGSGSERVTISPEAGRTLIATVVRPLIITPSMRACPP